MVSKQIGIVEVDKFSKYFLEVISSYLGEREFGNLVIDGPDPKEVPKVYGGIYNWWLSFEYVSGATDGITVKFAEGVFSGMAFNDKVSELSGEQAKLFLELSILKIPEARLMNVKMGAAALKEQGYTLEQVVDLMTDIKDTKAYGPSERELDKLRQYCTELYSRQLTL